jgi:tyrosine-protein phosphatase SIW14
LAIGLFLFSFATPSAGTLQAKEQTQSSQPRAIGRKLEEKGVPNFGEVAPNLYRGGLLNDAGIKALKRLGIDVVVNSSSDNLAERREVESLGMKYVAIPWHCPWPHDEVFAKFLQVVHDNQSKKIFVHCRLGDDRTGMMVAAYRIAEEGWTADEAMNEMKSFGFTASHHVLCPTLANYEKQFPKRLKNDAAFAAERARHQQ